MPRPVPLAPRLVVRLRRLQPHGGPGLQQGILSLIRSAGRNAAGVFDVRSRLYLAAAGRVSIRSAWRSARPSLRARRYPNSHGRRDGADGCVADLSKLGHRSTTLLVALRFLQGAAIGGEWAGAVLLSMEHGASYRRGHNASAAQVGPACGTILGTAVIAAITVGLSPAAFESWGWRIPLCLSLILVIFGLWLRRGVEETPAFLALESRHATARTPIKDVFTLHRRSLLIAGGARVGSDVTYALLIVFTITYVTTVLHLSRASALTATMIGAACNRWPCRSSARYRIELAGSLSMRLERVSQ